MAWFTDAAFTLAPVSACVGAAWMASDRIPDALEAVRRSTIRALGGHCVERATSTSVMASLLDEEIETAGRYPRRTDTTYAASVWHVEAGEVREIEVGSTLAIGGARAWFSPGHRDPATDGEKLEVAAITLRRCVPWCRAYVGCGLSHQLSAGAAPNSLHGLADGAGNWILMELSLRPDRFLSTLNHEIWHIAETAMTDAAIAVVDAAVLVGGEFAGSTYVRSRVERRARAYQHWCAARAEGRGLADVTSEVGSLFLAVSDGSFARELGCEYRRDPEASAADRVAAALAADGQLEDPAAGFLETALRAWASLGGDFGDEAFHTQAEFASLTMQTHCLLEGMRRDRAPIPA